MKKSWIAYCSKVALWLVFVLFPISARAATFTVDTAIPEGDLTYEGQPIVVDGCTLTADGPHEFASVEAINGALITHTVDSTGLVFNVSGAFILNAEASIDVSNMGTLPLPETLETSGGSYGGRGGQASSNKDSCPTFGDMYWPVHLGSGGRGGYGRTTRGGGRIQITAGSMTLDGSLLANGQKHTLDNTAAGSGGSILLDIGTLEGSGLIQANGETYSRYAASASGGGGRIAVYYDDATAFDLTGIECAGGHGGGAGTIFLKDKAEEKGQLRLDCLDRSHNEDRFTPIHSATNGFDRLYVGSQARLDLRPTNALHLTETLVTGAFVTVTGNITGPEITLSNGSWTHTGSFGYSNAVTLTGASMLTHGTGYSNGLQIAATTVSVASNATIQANGNGDLPLPATGSTAGGSYGGRGGKHYSYDSNPAFGDLYWPVDLGTGGTGSQGRTTRGGGRIQITADTLNLDGSVQANGQVATTSNTAGGSGGSIFLNVGALSGSGMLQANGGQYGQYAGPASGGGGRIAVYYDDATAFDLEKVECGGAYGAGAGTIFLKDNTDSFGALRLDNLGRAHDEDRFTPVDITTNRFDRLRVTDMARLNLQLTDPLQLTESIVTGAYAAVTGDVSGPDLLLTDGSWTHTGSFGFTQTITLEGSSTLSHGAGYSNGLQIAAATVSVSSNSTIQANATGDLPLPETGSTAGGSYGGRGGKHYSDDSNPAFGDLYWPVDLGTGGTGSQNRKTRGGGRIQIIADTLNLNGSLQANGQAPTTDNTAGGSGGSILLDVGTLNGIGMLQANGGQYGRYAGPASGGGGRIAVYYDDATSFDLENIECAGASGGGAGTIFLKDKAEATGALRLDNQGRTHDEDRFTPVDITTNRFDRLLVAGNARLNMLLTEPLVLTETMVTGAFATVIGDVSGPDITLIDGSWTHSGIFKFNQEIQLIGTSTLSHGTGYSNGLQIDAVSVMVESNSTINVSGRGDWPIDGTTGRSGGSYGGQGGTYTGTSCPIYGDAYVPADLGSGGIGSSGRRTRGGGWLRLAAVDLQLDGALIANGQSSQDYCGAGSGGSILVDVRYLTGTGTIQANGANPGAYSSGYGGGGRVAVYYSDMTGFTSTTIEAKAAGSGTWGSVYLAGPRQVNITNIGPGNTQPAGSLIILFGRTNTFTFFPDPSFQVLKVYADSNQVAGDSATSYDWVNNGLMRENMDDATWAERVLNGDQLEVVFALAIVGTMQDATGITIDVQAAADWLYTLYRTDDMEGDTWTPIQQDVRSTENGVLSLKDTAPLPFACYRVTGQPAP